MKRAPFRRGSSPRVRGRRGPRPLHGAGARLIPAGAGQTCRVLPPRRPGRAHPRGCGADVLARVAPAGELGSSPRVRGRLGRDLEDDELAGLIPAGAGQTSSVRRSASPATAHPRGCGADLPGGNRARGCGGSSPRVRGRRRRTSHGDKLRRLIPAGAGQTHPDDAVTFRAPGSSPRVRGRRTPTTR